jgi:hypothetical protein
MPVRPVRSVTPDPTSPPTTSCLPVSGSRLGRALGMRSHSLSDVSSIPRVDDLKHFRPIGKLVSLNMDGSQTILLNKPPHGPFGFYIARGTSKYKHGMLPVFLICVVVWENLSVARPHFEYMCGCLGKPRGSCWASFWVVSKSNKKKMYRNFVQKLFLKNIFLGDWNLCIKNRPLDWHVLERITEVKINQ